MSLSANFDTDRIAVYNLEKEKIGRRNKRIFLPRNNFLCYTCVEYIDFRIGRKEMLDMAKRLQTIVLFCIIWLMTLSCVHVDNTRDLFMPSTCSLDYTITVGTVDSETIDVSRGCSRVEQQDYLSANQSARLSTTLFKRSQTNYKSHQRQELTIAILDVVSKVVLFSFIMILCATGCAGLSMPFRCLLSYIHGMDGKKRIA